MPECCLILRPFPGWYTPTGADCLWTGPTGPTCPSWADPFAGADGVVVSAHKTLPALGQAALLFTNGMDPDRVRRMASVFGTSSPSYPILASMDAARAWLEGDGARAYRQTALRVAQLRSRFPCPGRGTCPWTPPGSP